MGFEFDLGSVEQNDEIAILKHRLSPRFGCERYIADNGGRATLLPRSEFDGLHEDDFEDGPYEGSWGDGYGEPHNPFKQAFGKLKDGKVIYCELNSERQEDISKLIKLTE